MDVIGNMKINTIESFVKLAIKEFRARKETEILKMTDEQLVEFIRLAQGKLPKIRPGSYRDDECKRRSVIVEINADTQVEIILQDIDYGSRCIGYIDEVLYFLNIGRFMKHEELEVLRDVANLTN